jgi:hypothetical protein
MPNEIAIPDLESKVQYTTYWLKLVDYQLEGYHIYDLVYGVRCGCCGEFSIITKKNVDDQTTESERSIFLASAHGDAAKCTDILSGGLDSMIRFQDDREGAYDSNGVFVSWPLSNIEITNIIEDRSYDMTRRQSQSQKLAMFFISNIVGRTWTTEDFHGPAMKHAKSLLERYDADTIAGCLEAIRDGIIGDGSFEIKYMSAIETTGEPTWIAQWKAYCETEPAVYLEQTHAEWIERKDKVYPELLPDEKPEPVKTPKPRRKKPATQLPIGSI